MRWARAKLWSISALWGQPGARGGGSLEDKPCSVSVIFCSSFSSSAVSDSCGRCDIVWCVGVGLRGWRGVVMLDQLYPAVLGFAFGALELFPAKLDRATEIQNHRIEQEAKSRDSGRVMIYASRKAPRNPNPNPQSQFQPHYNNEPPIPIHKSIQFKLNTVETECVQAGEEKKKKKKGTNTTTNQKASKPLNTRKRS